MAGNVSWFYDQHSETCFSIKDGEHLKKLTDCKLIKETCYQGDRHEIPHVFIAVLANGIEGIRTHLLARQIWLQQKESV
jgi:hypothetical protein